MTSGKPGTMIRINVITGKEFYTIVDVRPSLCSE